MHSSTEDEEKDLFAAWHRHSGVQRAILVSGSLLRQSLGDDAFERCGHFIDSGMGPLIDGFLKWDEFPAGHTKLEGHTDWIMAAAISGSGRDLYTASHDQRIIKWDLTRGELTANWTAHEGPVLCLALYSDILVSGGEDQKLKVWRVDSGLISMLSKLRSDLSSLMLVDSIDDHINHVTCVEFTDSGEYFVSGSKDGSVRVYSIKVTSESKVKSYRFECVKHWHRDSHFILSLLNIGENLVLSVSFYGQLRVFDRNQRRSEEECILERTLESKPASWGLSMNCDGTLLACLSKNSSLTVFEWPSFKVHRQIDASYKCVRFHPRFPRRMALSFRFGDLMLMNLRNGKEERLKPGHMGDIDDLCFSPDGSRLVSVSKDQVIWVWDLSEMNESLK